MSTKSLKITHYLNKRLKPTLINNVLEYPVYVRVSYGRKNERIKSDWFVHPCSEYDFENDKYFLELKKYESEIISEIIKDSDDEGFNLSARLEKSKTYLTEIFYGWLFEKREVQNQIVSFISKKTKLRESTIDPIFARIEYNSEEWKDLYSKDFFTKETQEKAIYLSMLLEFEEKNYPPLPDEIFGYRAGCVFVKHEWFCKNKKNEFIEFAKKQNLLKIDKVDRITRKFEDAIKNQSTFDMRWSD